MLIYLFPAAAKHQDDQCGSGNHTEVPDDVVKYVMRRGVPLGGVVCVPSFIAKRVEHA